MNQRAYLPQPPTQYSAQYMDQLLLVLRRFFNQLTMRQAVQASTLNFDLGTLPTEADIADLVPGDVYRDTTADNALKVVP